MCCCYKLLLLTGGFISRRLGTLIDSLQEITSDDRPRDDESHEFLSILQSLVGLLGVKGRRVAIHRNLAHKRSLARILDDVHQDLSRGIVDGGEVRGESGAVSKVSSHRLGVNLAKKKICK